MATKKFGVSSPFLSNRPTQNPITRAATLDAASLAARNQAKEAARVNTLRNANFKGDPYSYGYNSEQIFYDDSSTPLAQITPVAKPITNNPVTINNVAKVGADDITQYLSGAFKSIEPQYGEVAPNRVLNRNSIEGYSIKFGKGGVAKKAVAEIEGILSRLPKGSAASQAKVASELEQAAADKAALYTAAPISNKTGKNAIAEAKKTLSEPKAKKPLTKQQFQNQYVQHIDIRGREGDAEENAKAIMEQGFRRGVNANAYTPFSGLPHRDVVSAKFQPLEGDVVYLAPKGQWVTTPNGVKIKEGWKPQPHEVIRVKDPKKSMYEYYLESQNSDGALKQLEAPSVIIPSKLAEVEKYVRGREGSHGANRVQYAADQIKNLERQYTEEALKQAFSGDNARALMIGDPNKFQDYAARIEKPSKGGIAEYKYFMSKEGGGADDVPYLALDRETGEIPYVSGHEGRHRNLALSEMGDENTLWRMLPRASLREHLPRRSQEEYLDALVKEIGNPAEVSPEERKGVLVRKLPEMFLKGGLASIAKYDKQGRRKFGIGGGTYTATAKAGKDWKPNPNVSTVIIGPFGIPMQVPLVQQLIETDTSENPTSDNTTGQEKIIINNLQRKFNPYTGDAYKYGISGQGSHEFYSAAMAKGGLASIAKYDSQGRQKLADGGETRLGYKKITLNAPFGGIEANKSFQALSPQDKKSVLEQRAAYIAAYEKPATPSFGHKDFYLQKPVDYWIIDPLYDQTSSASNSNLVTLGTEVLEKPTSRSGRKYNPYTGDEYKYGISGEGGHEFYTAAMAKGGVLHLAKGSQEFPLQKPAEVTEADLTPTEVNPIAGMASRGLAKVHDFLVKPYGYENPPMEIATDFVGMPSWIKFLENKAYGTPSYSGSGQAIRLNEEAIDPLLTVIGGAKPAAKAVAKVTKKIAKEAAPYAANQAVNLMEKYGVSPTMNVVKPKGGNWTDMDRTVNALKIRRPADHSPPEKVLKDFDQYWNPRTMSTLTEEGAADKLNRRQNIVNQISINNWIDKKLGNYIKNELATPEDSIRLGMERRVEQAKKIKADNDAKLANMKEAINRRKAEGKDTTLSERDYEAAKEKADQENLFANRSVSHLSAPEEGWALNLYRDDYYPNQASIDKRIEAGFPEEGLSTNNQAAKLWEDVSDYFVDSRLASSVPEGSYILKDNPWIAKVVEKDPNTPLYSVDAVDLNQDLEFRHMIDELQEAMSTTSVLPQNLRISEKDLEKMTIDDVSALSGKITAWRAAQKVKADKEIANNPAMHTFKEYTENNPKGVKWQQIKRPEGYSPEEQEEFVRAATKYEGDLMRHCVGGAGHCDPLLNNEVEIYSLRDAKGVPHVTIEVDKGVNAPSFYERNKKLLELPELKQEHDDINETAENSAEYVRRVIRLLNEHGYKEGKDYFISNPKLPSIREIKGKGNQKPNDEYIPFIQDFIKSGKWDEIDDISNTGLRSSRSVLGEGVVKALRDRGEYVPPVIGFDEAVKFQEMYNPNAFKDITTVEDYRKTWDRGGIGDGYAEGGAVEPTDDLMSLVDEHFLNEPVAFGIGGVARKLAGKAAKSLEGQLDDAAQKLLDEHLVKKAKSAADDKFLPLDLPRTTRSKQQIESHAERVARQMMGEHVRDPKNPKDSANLAGRSMKEVERLKNIDYTLEKTKDLPVPQIVDPQIGDVNILTVGDITVADRNLVDVNGYPIHSTQEGGPFFGKGKLHLPDDESLWWASEESSAQNFQNRVDEIAERYGIDKLKAHHLAMGQQANNFAMHFADANLKAINTFGVPEEGIGAINSTVRNGFSIIKDGKRIDFKFPDFPGVENLDEAYKYFRENPEARKWFNNRMKTPTLTQEYGLPNGLDIQWAITDPLLRNMEINLTGRSVGDVYKGAELTDTADHGTYGKGIRGKFQGTTRYPIPMELSHSDAYDYTAARKNKAHITGTLQKVAPHQIVDQQYLDEIGYYNDLIKKYTGKRKGGSVKKDNQITADYAIAPEAKTGKWSKQDEKSFQSGIRGTKWYQQFVGEYGEPPDLNSKDYNYRAAWKAGVRPQDYEYDADMQHWASTTGKGESLKSTSHPTAWMEDYMQVTGSDPHEPVDMNPEQIKAIKKALMYRYGK